MVVRVQRDLRPEGISRMNDPCAFSPDEKTARLIARFYAQMFSPGSRILELGFGQGHFLEAARDSGLLAMGIDRDEHLVAIAEAAGHKVLCGTATSFRDLEPASMDGVVAAHLIEHLVPDEVAELLRLAGEVLVPGGILLLSTPNTKDWRVVSDLFWLDPTHVRPYPAGAVQQLAKRDDWTWDADGYEPTRLGRKTVWTVLNRSRFGRDFGRSSVWFRLRRAGG